jgi:type IX secretion system PorP/SprF family membrane protein
MSVIKKGLLILFLAFSFNVSDGQQTPLNPMSYWVFFPYIYNPAIIGSKDYLSVDLTAAFQGKSKTQILSANTRFLKTKPGYFSTPVMKEFNNIGIGGSVFNDINGLSKNTGVSAGGSYQIPLNTRDLSFLSFGVSGKGVYNTLDADTTEPGNISKKTFYPNIDAGIYYYGTNLFIGVSAINLLGNPEDPDSLGRYAIPVSRQYFFTAGYKILLSRSLNIVLEPSVQINANDTTINNIAENINPILKLYVENFCFGTYFLSDGKISFFSQFRYPRFYIGAFFELPKKTPYFKRTPMVELTMGFNFQPDRSRFSRQSRW